MNYEQLEIYFGSPGVSIIYPTAGESFSPGYKDLDLLRTIEFEADWSIRLRWEVLFNTCRVMNKTFRRKKLPFDRLVLRTGILCPRSHEGKQYYGKVLLFSMRLDKPIGPSQIELLYCHFSESSKRVAFVPRWDAMPEGVPMPDYENRVPLPLRQAWFKGLTSIPNAPAVLGLNAWECLL